MASEEKTWFPRRDIFNFWVIYDYFNELTYKDIDSVRVEYTIVLAFIDEIIIAYRENIRRIIDQDIASLKRPALVDGNLTMVETKNSNTIGCWGSERESYTIDNLTNHKMHEAVNIIGSIRMRNYLIDFWFSKTGETLANHVEEYPYINFIQRLIK